MPRFLISSYIRSWLMPASSAALPNATFPLVEKTREDFDPNVFFGHVESLQEVVVNG
jgi:hypothetical protein